MKGHASIKSNGSSRETNVTSSGGGGSDSCPPAWPLNQTVQVRELLAFIPWYFGIIPKENSSLSAGGGDSIAYEKQWDAVLDHTNGYGGQYGLRTATLDSRCYNYSGTWHDHECNWNGPSWPYETSRVLSGLGNLLLEYPSTQHGAMNSSVFLDLLNQYTKQHTGSHPINGTTPWIGENIHPDEGYWIARWIMYMKQQPLRNRGHNYNHSTFIDIILSYLFGIRAQLSAGDLIIDPTILLASNVKYAAVDNLLYHGKNLAIVWDADGTHYKTKRVGLCVYIQGQKKACGRPGPGGTMPPLKVAF